MEAEGANEEGDAKVEKKKKKKKHEKKKKGTERSSKGQGEADQQFLLECVHFVLPLVSLTQLHFTQLHPEPWLD